MLAIAMVVISKADAMALRLRADAPSNLGPGSLRPMSSVVG